MNTLMQEGWRCPVCGNVNAPWVASCPCGGRDNYHFTSTGTDYKPKNERRKTVEEFMERWKYEG